MVVIIMVVIIMVVIIMVVIIMVVLIMVVILMVVIIIQIHSILRVFMTASKHPDSAWKRSSKTCMKLISAECTVENP
jgi:hypothetical protein